MDSRRRSSEQLRDAYRVPGFTPCHTVTGVQGDPHVRVVTLTRGVKKRSAAHVERRIAQGMIVNRVACAISHAAMCASISRSISDASTVANAAA